MLLTTEVLSTLFVKSPRGIHLIKAPPTSAPLHHLERFPIRSTNHHLVRDLTSCALLRLHLCIQSLL